MTGVQTCALPIWDLRVAFVPQLIPLTRGMLISAYLPIAHTIEPIEILQEFYEGCEFVRIREKPVDIKSVAGSNFCDIFAKQKDGMVFVSSAIDNLLRGASSQAVVNANIMFGFEDSAGIPRFSYVP